MGNRFRGLIAATYTPFDSEFNLNLDQVGPLTQHLIDQRVSGVFVCGSTGEGMSLTTQERKDITVEFRECAANTIPVIVHVGHNCLHEACDLARHAQAIGAAAVSATCPSYFPVGSVEILIESMAQVAAAAPDLPFYFYHIPVLTGIGLSMVEFLEKANDRIPNLVGMKYTCPTIHEFQACAEMQDRKFEVMWGADEMLLSALAVGAKAAVGSTYNIAGRMYDRMIEAFSRGDIQTAAELQSRSVQMIRAIAQYPFHPAMKIVMKSLGVDCGACRLPLSRLDESEEKQLLNELNSIGCYDWIQ